MMSQSKLQNLKDDATIKDRRFQIAQGVFMVTVSIAIAGVLLLLYNNTEQARAQLVLQQTLLEQQKKTTDDLKKNTADQLSRQTRYIECIAKFFANPDRTKLVIADLDACLLQQVGIVPSESVSDSPPNNSPPLASSSPTSPPTAAITQPSSSPSPAPSSSPSPATASPPPSQDAPEPVLVLPPTLVQTLDKVVKDLIHL